jgi:integrase
VKFGEFVELLWKPKHRSNVSPGWKLSQDQMLRDYATILNELNLKEIQPIHIHEVLHRMQEQNRSSQLIIHVWNLLHKIFDTASGRLYRLIHPYDNPVLEELKPKLVWKETPFWNVEQSFVFVVKVRGHRFEAAFFIGLFCALRIGEIQGLDWADFDWDHKEISVIRHYCRKTKKMVPRTKNGQPHKVPMPDLLVELLMPIRKSSGHIVEYLGHHICQVAFHKTLKRLCKEFGLPEISAQGLRHSCTEIWVEQGATLTDIARLLNHKTEKSTPRYMHRADRRLKEIASKIKKFSA